MRSSFRGYFPPTAEELDQLWSSALFAFDANVLLNVYRYTEQTQQKMLAILSGLGDRVWIPHQAALEFHRNRPRVIADHAAAYEKATTEIGNAFETLKGRLRSDFTRHPVIDCGEIIDILDETRARLIATLQGSKAKHPDFATEDALRDKLIAILSDEKVGKAFDPKRKETLNGDAEKRAKQKVPPGYNDKDKQHPYGDYYVWSQLLDRAKECSCPIILVTDERKDDWWVRIEGRTIGPRSELIEEMFECSGQVFYMYRPDAFIELAAKRFGVEGSDEAVREVRTAHEHVQDEIGLAVQTAAGVDPNSVLGVPGQPIAVVTVNGSFQPPSLRSLEEEPEDSATGRGSSKIKRLDSRDLDE
jgi:hypothetical protein